MKKKLVQVYNPHHSLRGCHFHVEGDNFHYLQSRKLFLKIPEGIGGYPTSGSILLVTQCVSDLIRYIWGQ